MAGQSDRQPKTSEILRFHAVVRATEGLASATGPEATFSPASYGFLGAAANALSGAYEAEIAGMLTIIKGSLLGAALMLLESCTGYLTNYQTPCVEGHVCECVQYTTLNRSWLDCRDYGRAKPRPY
jgi:hypothetical protein